MTLVHGVKTTGKHSVQMWDEEADPFIGAPIHRTAKRSPEFKAPEGRFRRYRYVVEKDDEYHLIYVGELFTPNDEVYTYWVYVEPVDDPDEEVRELDNMRVQHPEITEDFDKRMMKDTIKAYHEYQNIQDPKETRPVRKALSELERGKRLLDLIDNFKGG